MADPLVSVVMPVYNGERFLDQALDSLAAQDYPELEVIVVDDGSTDSTAAVAARYEVRYVQQEHAGVSVARNRGIEEARGDLIGFLDSDDVWTTDAVSKQASYLCDHPGVAFVVPKMLFFVEPGCTPPYWIKPEWQTEPTVSYLPMARREVFEQVGGFDPSYQIGEDLDWLARARDLDVELAILPDVVRRYRIHGENSIYAMTGKHIFRVVRARMARQRAANEIPGLG
jgi:glycosyltransferase involved in cell wall biosynthesis